MGLKIKNNGVEHQIEKERKKKNPKKIRTKKIELISVWLQVWQKTEQIETRTHLKGKFEIGLGIWRISIQTLNRYGPGLTLKVTGWKFQFSPSFHFRLYNLKPNETWESARETQPSRHVKHNYDVHQNSNSRLRGVPWQL